jgi:hypothetical protein
MPINFFKALQDFAGKMLCTALIMLNLNFTAPGFLNEGLALEFQRFGCYGSQTALFHSV